MYFTRIEIGDILYFMMSLKREAKYLTDVTKDITI